MKPDKLTLALMAGLVLVLAPAATAHAQGGDEVELGDEPLPSSDDEGGSPGGAEENPNAPVTLLDDQDAATPEKKKKVDDGVYPIEIAKRPLTLHAGMSEIGLFAGLTFDPITLNGALAADYGVTRQVQIGLRYSPGALIDGEFETGKTVGIEARYLIEDWVAAQLAIPVLLDPFGMAIEAGAPMKFVFDKFSLLFGEDLIAVKIHRLIPDPDNAAFTAGLVAVDALNTTLASAEVRVIGGLIYQLDPSMAVTVKAGLAVPIDAPDTQTTRWPTNVRITKSRSNKLDFGLEAFVYDWNEFSSTAGLGAFANLRI